MLTLPIKRGWYDMIRRGEKTEEYRDVKDFWTKRLSSAFGGSIADVIREQRCAWIRLRNGYSAKSPSLLALVTLRIDKGRTAWGADPDAAQYILQIDELREERR